MNLTVVSFFEMMNIGVAHMLLLIHFNTPSLTSLSNSTFRVHSFFFIFWEQGKVCYGMAYHLP